MTKERTKYYLANYKLVTSTFQQVVGYEILRHNIPNIWLETQGEDITVAVIDTGCQLDHPDLVNSAIQGWNFHDDIQTVSDGIGHGTHVSGTITANNNDIGVVGVAPLAKVLVIKVLGDEGWGYAESVAQGISFAVKQKVDIISMSLGGAESSNVIHDAIQEAYKQHIPCICAAGNSGDTGSLSFPARYSETISIGALNSRNLRAEFSQTGPRLDFMAPGVNINSTYINSQYASLSGTCLTKESLVYTPNGPISIKCLKIRQSIYSFNMNTQSIEESKVVNHWIRGKKQVRTIRTKHGEITCTDNHPILLFEHDFVWKPSCEIKAGDLLVSASGDLTKQVQNKQITICDEWFVQLRFPLNVSRKDIKSFEFNCNIDSAVAFLNAKYGLRYHKVKKLLSDLNVDRKNLIFGSGSSHKIPIPEIDNQLAYLCGFFLGDGWISKHTKDNGSKQSSVCFAECNIPEINQRFTLYFKNVFLSELTLNKSGRWYYKFNLMISDIFEQLLGNKRACQKQIPSWIFNQPKHIIENFISGIIDADGWKLPKGHGISSCSKELMNGLAALCDYIGTRRGNISKRTRLLHPPKSPEPIISTEYSLTLSMNSSNFYGVKLVEEFVNPEQYSNIASSTQVKLSKVMKITEQKNPQIVYDIEVENNHNFIANNIIVHNSMATPWTAGVVALMMAKHRKIGGKTPLHTVEDVREHLKKTSLDLDVAGKDPKTGFGLIDVEKSIQQIEQGEKEMPNLDTQTLLDQVNAWIIPFDEKYTQRDTINTQIAELQAQLTPLTTEIEAFEEKTAQIRAIIGQ